MQIDMYIYIYIYIERERERERERTKREKSSFVSLYKSYILIFVNIYI